MSKYYLLCVRSLAENRDSACDVRRCHWVWALYVRWFSTHEFFKDCIIWSTFCRKLRSISLNWSSFNVMMEFTQYKQLQQFHSQSISDFSPALPQPPYIWSLSSSSTATLHLISLQQFHSHPSSDLSPAVPQPIYIWPLSSSSTATLHLISLQ